LKFFLKEMKKQSKRTEKAKERDQFGMDLLDKIPE